MRVEHKLQYLGIRSQGEYSNPTGMQMRMEDSIQRKRLMLIFYDESGLFKEPPG